MLKKIRNVVFLFVFYFKIFLIIELEYLVLGMDVMKCYRKYLKFKILILCFFFILKIFYINC